MTGRATFGDFAEAANSHLAQAAKLAAAPLAGSAARMTRVQEFTFGLSSLIVVLERYLRMGLIKFASLEVADEIKGFFAGKDCRGFDRGLGVVDDTVRGQALYRMRDEAVVREWLGANGY